jgi:surface polysaccharide O-acyltransferase-like enzyme
MRGPEPVEPDVAAAPAPAAAAMAGRVDDRQAWADWARILAIVAVVSIHVLGSVSFRASLVGTPFWWAVNIINSASRWSVPVFFMVSGALLLNRAHRNGSGDFYRRRFTRIGIPLVAWSLIYAPVLVYQGIRVTPGSWLTSMAAGAPYGHLFFLFALLGCYLVIPLLERLPSRELGVFAALAVGWAVAQRALQITVPHSPVNALELWLYFVGFFAAGGWLVRRPPRRRSLWVVAFGIAVAVTAAGTWWLVRHSAASEWTYFYSYLSVATVVASVAAFEWIRATEWPRPPWLRTLAATTFGIYLCNPLILVVVRQFVPITGGPFKPSIDYVVEMVAVLLGSLGLTLVLMRIPYVRSIVGG